MALFDHGSVYMPYDDPSLWPVDTRSLALALGLSQRHVARLCHNGVIKAKRSSSGRFLIETEEVDSQIELRKGNKRLKYRPLDHSSIVDYWVPFGVGFAPLADHWHYQRGEAGASPLADSQGP